MIDEVGAAAVQPAADRAWPRSFADRLTGPLPSTRDLWRLLRERPPTRRLLAGAPAIPVHASRRLPPLTGQASVTWVGHATFILRLGGLIILTDPVFSRRIPGVLPRVSPVGVPWSALPRVDAVVISHNHYDHLDAPTLRRLPRDTPVLVPANLGDWFRRRRFTRVTELDWWESHRIGPVRCDLVPAHHWSRRTLTDTCRSLWGGWVFTVDSDASGGSTAPTGKSGTRVYFAGDTGYGHFFRQIGARYPGIELALMPVGAYHPRWFMRPMHLDPEEAVQAFQEIGASRMVPMHWGTFILSHEPVLEPLERTRRAWAAAGLPAEHLWDLSIGETRQW
ncbi:MAG TPA: MBL fold metallo-hydrolase [Natronosporangium sp.]|jgi:L-ascorbate metabolism protein UlaG (beta-lactamase superfamily)|nr:MBL fold metallo-hydrolase [Natronosporangium sp.]